MEALIPKLKRVLSQSVLSEADVAFVMTSLRVCIEKADVSAAFPALKLYADWVSHPQLDRSHALEAFEAVAEAFTSLQGEALDPMWDVIADGFRLEALLSELQTFTAAYSLPAEHFNEGGRFAQFLSLLFDILLTRPIEFPRPLTKPAKAIRDRITARLTARVGRQLEPKRLSIVRGWDVAGGTDGMACFHMEVVPDGQPEGGFFLHGLILMPAKWSADPTKRLRLPLPPAPAS